MAYSEDFRKKAIEFVDAGHTQKELKEVFGIYPSELAKWRKLLKETGSLKTQYPKTRARKIDLKRLEKEIERKPDANLSELAVIFNCTSQAVFYALKKLKITYKKNSQIP